MALPLFAAVCRCTYAVLARRWLPLTFFCRVRPDYFRILNIIRIPAYTRDAYTRTRVHAHTHREEPEQCRDVRREAAMKGVEACGRERGIQFGREEEVAEDGEEEEEEEAMKKDTVL